MFAMLDSKKSCASKFVRVFESGFHSTRAEQFMESLQKGREVRGALRIEDKQPQVP